MLKRTFFVIVLSIYSICIFSQETPSPEGSSTADANYEPLKKNYYWFNPYVSVCVPNPMNNKALKKNFAGVYEINAAIDIGIFKGIFVGAGYKNATLKVTGLVGAQNFHYNPLMKMDNAGIRVGFKTFIGAKNRIVYSASFTMGNSMIHFTKMENDSIKPAVTKYSTSYIEPEMGIYFLVESNFSVGVTMSYGLYHKQFDPYEIGLNQVKPIGTVGSGSTQILSFGFGVCYNFLKKKE
ncbi:MAG TPA: hypothetical protein VFF27_02265 [Bacteroidia bacterium]|jgi:hypothetical protein|nr:hypothetical protein [Bacteroidia bacterium]